LPQGSEAVELDPAEFTTEIDNPYLPFAVGNRWVYRETEDGEPDQRVVVVVTDRTKTIANGIEAVVVRDTVTQGGELVELTDDWFAQDSEGNVWYLGEDTVSYENGKPDRSGSFEAGVNGADAGVIMPAHPEAGMTYREEYYKGHAEDRSKVLSLDEQAESPFGHFTGALLTKDYTPVEPDVLEYKLYAKGVGPVLTLNVSGASGREELLHVSTP
jgi:hypothetical protein